MAKTYSRKEITQHSSKQDAWVIVDGRVCDVTGFLRSHPGGLEVLDGHLGTDISKLLRSPDYHQHSRAAYEILDLCCIGAVEGMQQNGQVCYISLEHKIILCAGYK